MRKADRNLGVFSLAGRIAVRAPWIVVSAWVALIVVLSLTFPALTTVVESRSQQPLPAPAMAASEQMATDFHESAQNILVVALTDQRGLNAGDDNAYRALSDTLRGDTTDVSAVEDFITTPALRQTMVSKDGKASYLAVSLKAPAGSPESSEAYKRITTLVEHSTAGTGMTAHVTGQAAIAGDLSIVSARDMHLIEIATAILVLAILAVIYRRPATVLLPLITIGVSVVAAQGVVSALAGAGLGVSTMTIVLMTAMIVGAGTDYAVFLISRYHEYVRSGVDSDAAVQKALSSIGAVIAASAATVAVTFLGMVFARLEAFTSVGPALAISIVVAFLAAVTLLPALLVLAGRRGWVSPRNPLTSRLWRRSGVQIARRPKTHLVASLTVLIALGACVAFIHPTFNDRMQLPASAESNQGFSEMAEHFSASALLPQYIYIRSPHDLRTSQSLADMEQLAQRVAQLPGVTSVRGVTRPTGQPLDQAKLSYQAGQVGSNLADASSQISTRSADLDSLSTGAHRLATSLASVRDRVDQAGRSMNSTTTALASVQRQLTSPQTIQLLNTIRSYADGPEGNSSAIDAVQQLIDLLQSAQAAVGSAGTQAGARQIAQIQQGADQLADGSQKLADGVQALVDQTKKMGSGMDQAASLLLSMRQDASGPSMAGMYIPQQVVNSDDFRNAAKVFISPDGHSARYLVESAYDPFSAAAMDQVNTILDTARGAQPNTTLSDATISMVGTTPMYSTIRTYYNGDLRVIIILTLVVVFLILVALLRAIVAPLYLIATVVVSFMSALGLGVLVFQFLLHQPLFWNVPATVFIVLVAVGADYNLLLISRIREESVRGVRSGIVKAVHSTGGVITSAGIIFAASMFGLLFGSVSTMVQTGFIIGAGLLIDTFVVRTVTVPAIAALVGQANWWPSRAPARR